MSKNKLFKNSIIYFILIAFFAIIIGSIILLWNYNIIIPPKFFTKTVTVIKIKKVEVPKFINENNELPTTVLIEYLKPTLDPSINKEISKAINKYSEIYQLPKKLIISMILKESSFHISSTSNANAIGLMQIIPKYHEKEIKAIGVKDIRKLYYIDNNINLGCKILKNYLNQHNQNIDKALVCYLSKKSSEKLKEYYRQKILSTWARLNFYEFKKGLES